MRGPENPVEKGQVVNPPAIEIDERGHKRFFYLRLTAVAAFAIMSGFAGIMAGISVSRWLDLEISMSVLAGNILGYAVPLVFAKKFGVLD